MKRYYSIDFLAMKHFDLNPTKWMVCENIHFTQAISESGYCEHTRTDLAEHHELSTAGLKRIIAELVDKNLLKRNKKNHLKTTPKWHKIQGSKNATLDDFGGSKNATAGEQKCYGGGSKNATPQPIRENLDRDRENKSKLKNQNTKVAFRFLIEEIQSEATRKSKVQFTEKGFEAYKLIEDKSQIKSNYIKHQEQKDQYAQTIANFLIDYVANVKELQQDIKTTKNKMGSLIDSIVPKEDEIIDVAIKESV